MPDVVLCQIPQYCYFNYQIIPIWAY